MKTKRKRNRQKKKKQTKEKEILDSNEEVLINKAYLTVTIPEQSTKGIFWHPFVYVLFKKICRFQEFYSLIYYDFQYVCHLLDCCRNS